MSLLINRGSQEAFDNTELRRWDLVMQMIKHQKELIDLTSEEFTSVTRRKKKESPEAMEKIHQILEYTATMRELIDWLGRRAMIFGSRTAGMIKIPLEGDDRFMR